MSYEAIVVNKNANLENARKVFADEVSAMFGLFNFARRKCSDGRYWQHYEFVHPTGYVVNVTGRFNKNDRLDWSIEYLDVATNYTVNCYSKCDVLRGGFYVDTGFKKFIREFNKLIRNPQFTPKP